MPTISQRAVDKIVGYEVSSRAYYEKVLRRPEWPEGASGVTIGIGYDLGYASPAKIDADWGNHVPAGMLAVMKQCSGVTGTSARDLLPQVKGQISISWDSAMDVFLNRDVPEWTNRVCSVVPLADQLPPDSLGALVSLAYNRGASFNNQGDRYREMRDIKSHVSAHQWSLPPGDLRAMKRLWPNVSGLRKRRDDEAKLFEDGLTNPNAAPASHTVNEKPPVLPHDTVGPQETTAGTAGGGGTVVVANSAINSGLPVWAIIAIIAGCVAVTIAAIYFSRRYRQSIPVLARQKDPSND